MPIRSIPAAAALANIRRSAVARWPHRGDADNRIEPLASPAFVPSFRFAPGCTVFTIGSCFARNVEAVLEQNGFVVPTRKFWRDDAKGRAPDNWMLDNYGVASIFNEIAWGFGEVAFDPAVHFAELRPGLFADVHLPNRFALEPLAEVQARRERIFEVTRTLLTADVLVMTLGLAEVWKDQASNTYLNARPYQAMLAKDPDRYTLEVLSFEETDDFLKRTFEIIFRRCRDDLRVILSVSPVPMAATYTGQDVSVANQYSKSVLRVAAEAAAARESRIDYFPSYESIVLSDRATAWEDDLIHVRPRLIEHNVSRMIEAYTGVVAAPASTVDAAALASAAEHAALRHAQQFQLARRWTEAFDAAAPLVDGSLRPGALRVQATAALRLGRVSEAESLVRAAIEVQHNIGGLHGLLGEVLLAQGRAVEAEDCIAQALNHHPNDANWTALMIRARLAQSRREEASALLDEALRMHSSSPQLLRLRRELIASAP